MPNFFHATIKGLRADEDLESVLSLRVPGEDFDRVSVAAKSVKQVLMVGVFTEEEFLAFSERMRGEHG